MKTFWLLVAIVAVLLLGSFREGLTIDSVPTQNLLNKLKSAIKPPRTSTAPTTTSTSPAPAPAPTTSVTPATTIPETTTPETTAPPTTPLKTQTITPAPYVTGNSTGGTSTSSLGPNSGGTTDLKSRKVWGPEFQGVGIIAGADQGDTTGTRNYPFLIGPKGPESTRIDGLGIIPPSKNYQLANDGSLPPPESTGSAEGSQYLPNSRTPGDQDLIPDPYRVASAFTTSTYSSKTEPVPFLTDFSAFQK